MTDNTDDAQPAFIISVWYDELTRGLYALNRPRAITAAGLANTSRSSKGLLA